MRRIQKPISEFLTGKPALTVQPDARVMEAVELMTEQRREYVLVMEHDRLIGIFTERDFLNRVIGARLLPGETPVRDVMTPDPDQLRAVDNITYAIERMAARGYRNIPVVDEENNMAVLTVRDVMLHLSEVLAEVEEADRDEEALDEWTDTGGG